ncbi:hypothetical protein [Microvirga thermotolerans]|uniref:Uncharacterized protein n=1 Tax=Microvirga thermotolerans TaxID=2651334 RepID=A0A5P9K5K0_9HYPH|nr:hypothetical protein [Microvirga thermotolerans]QFU17824.1 hypothetical protein GDR74_17245 [Microvirga thermotolerans]
MAQDKRGRPPEPDVDEVLDELQAEEGGDDFVAGPTQRNEVGNTKRAAAKATGLMGATKKLDPDLDIAHVDDGRVTSGSGAGIRSFREVPPEQGAQNASLTLSNAEIAENVPTTALKSPATPPARTRERTAGLGTGISPDSGRQRVPAPGNAVTAPKGTFVRGHPTATQAGGRSQSSTGDEKPPKRSARGDGPQTDRPLSKGGREER